mmetsp:Transcript_15392/g.32055  ORF Transcript_15392/g.32055 Transcript_15392/m.32055 type:complete len:263 (+) Transcript_15392:577-1365(+)
MLEHLIHTFVYLNILLVIVKIQPLLDGIGLLNAAHNECHEIILRWVPEESAAALCGVKSHSVIGASIRAIQHYDVLLAEQRVPAFAQGFNLLLQFGQITSEGAEDQSETTATSLELPQEVEKGGQELHCFTRQTSIFGSLAAMQRLRQHQPALQERQILVKDLTRHPRIGKCPQVPPSLFLHLLVGCSKCGLICIVLFVWKGVFQHHKLRVGLKSGHGFFGGQLRPLAAPGYRLAFSIQLDATPGRVRQNHGDETFGISPSG